MLQTKSLLQHEALISFNNIGIGLKCHLLRSENVLTRQAWPQSRLAGKRKVDKGFRPDTNPSACQLSWWRVRLCPDKLTPTPQKRSPAKFGLMIQFTVISLNVITSDTSIYFYSSQNNLETHPCHSIMTSSSERRFVLSHNALLTTAHKFQTEFER